MKFQLHFIQTFSNEKISYIRIVDLDDLNKLGIQNFSIWDNLGFRKLVCKHRNFKITNLNRPNYLKWKVDQTNNCRSWWVEQTWYSKFFNLKSFRVKNTRVKVLFFSFDQIWLGQTCSNETLNDLRWKISEYQVWSSQQDLQLLHSSFSYLRKFYQTLVINSWIS